MAYFSCNPQFSSHGHIYQPDCLVGNFRDGFYSQIRGTGSGVFPISHVFPGHQLLGQPDGINAPPMIVNPDVGNIIELKRAYDRPGYDRILIRNM
jgi:hypothetical protein